MWLSQSLWGAEVILLRSMGFIAYGFAAARVPASRWPSSCAIMLTLLWHGILVPGLWSTLRSLVLASIESNHWITREVLRNLTVMEPMKVRPGGPLKTCGRCCLSHCFWHQHLRAKDGRVGSPQELRIEGNQSNLVQYSHIHILSSLWPEVLSIFRVKTKQN